MLSKKMAFSLTSLIIIFALAFVVTPAMAGEFGVSLYAVKDGNATADEAATLMDVSHADGLQVFNYDDTPASHTNLRVTIKFDQAVILEDGKISIDGFDKDSKYLQAVALIPAPANAAAATADDSPIWPITANRMITLTISLGEAAADAAMVRKITLKIDKGIESASFTNEDTSKELKTDIFLLGVNPALGPDVLKIAMVGEPFSPVTTASFQTHILLSEEPKGGFKADHIDPGESTVASIVKLASPPDAMMVSAIPVMMRTGETAFADTGADEETEAVNAIDIASWRDMKLHLYLVTFNTKEGEKTVTIKVKDFEGMERPTGSLTSEYYVRMADSMLTEGRDKLTVKTNAALTTAKSAGVEVNLLKDGIIPASGYLVVAKNKSGSAVRNPGDAKKSPVGTARQPFALTYNLIEGGLLNLEAFLINGGTIDIVSPDAGLVISEIMWGTDASLGGTAGADSVNSQYIEIRNTSGADIKMGDKTHKLVFYAAGSVLPDMSVATNNIQDRVGTVGAGGYWSVVGKGQSGRTGIGEGAADVVAVKPTLALISMQRSITPTGVAANGTMAGSWAASVPPGLNFDLTKVGTRVGSPGRAPTPYPVAPTPPPAPVVTPPTPVATAADIKITEIMVDTGNGRFPQWIELNNVSGKEVSLEGWSVEIKNTTADTDVIGSDLEIDLTGTLGISEHEGNAGQGKSLLLVSRDTPSKSTNLMAKHIVDVSSEVGAKGRYQLISDMAFMITLWPPQTSGRLIHGDMAGNLGANPAWEIPMSEAGRSSLIRYEMDAAGMATMGTAANGWVLASDVTLAGAHTWYGSDEDAGTPGYDAGGPLPVELSHFRPARDKATGAVVITWATQSELNNAGFFIKRSQQRDGEFKVINATMIAGAGTTSEKQFYTFTDTTAQPNVVYYYQIEDVSLDGNRQTLTRGIRLKGHIGAAGKATVIWGELKSSNE